MERQDVSERNAIEGKFGEGKRTYGVGLISACLQGTSETAISISLLMMNIGKILRGFRFFVYFPCDTFKKK
ncbi:transposase [Lentibacillus jeotgali]|uniref:transposase n=1 Tax=Lentibacillus jeotgali TaxID=558169 RepID=UPI0003022125